MGDEKPKREGNYGPPPPKALVIERERRAWKYKCEGRTNEYIGKKLGVSEEGARKILLRVCERETKRLSASYEHVRTKQLGQVGWVISEAGSAWRRSKQPRRRATRRSVEGEDAQTVETADSQCGDPRYLLLMLEGHRAERDLCGLSIQAATNPLNDPTFIDLARKLGSPYPDKPDPKDQESCRKDDTATASPESESDPRN